MQHNEPHAPGIATSRFFPTASCRFFNVRREILTETPNWPAILQQFDSNLIALGSQKLEAGFAHKKRVPIRVKTLRYRLFRPAPAPYARKLRRGCGCGGAEIRGRLVEYCDQPAKNLKQVLYTRTACRFGSRPYVTDCPPNARII